MPIPPIPPTSPADATPRARPPATGARAGERADKSERGDKGRRTAERILDVAEEVFADKGFDGATLRDVADGVGIRIPSLYNHYDGKESLYAAVLERGIGPLLQTLAQSALRRGDEGEPDEIVEQTIQLLALRPNLPRLVLHETLAGGRHLRKILQGWLGPLLAQAERLVEARPGASRWTPEQRPNLVLAMYHIVVGYFAIAPLYRDLEGVDLLSPEALERQTDFLRKLSMLLFGPEAR